MRKHLDDYWILYVGVVVAVAIIITGMRLLWHATQLPIYDCLEDEVLVVSRSGADACYPLDNLPGDVPRVIISSN